LRGTPGLCQVGDQSKSQTAIPVRSRARYSSSQITFGVGFCTDLLVGYGGQGLGSVADQAPSRQKQSGSRQTLTRNARIMPADQGSSAG
jgi:hypothetical protein